MLVLLPNLMAGRMCVWPWAGAVRWAAPINSCRDVGTGRNSARLRLGLKGFAKVAKGGVRAEIKARPAEFLPDPQYPVKAPAWASVVSRSARGLLRNVI